MKNESITRYFVRQLEDFGYTQRKRTPAVTLVGSDIPLPKPEAACQALRNTLAHYGGALPASVFTHSWIYLPRHVGPPSKYLKSRNLKEAGVKAISFENAIRLQKLDLPSDIEIKIGNGSLHDKTAAKDMIYYLEEKNLGAFVANNVVETGRVYRIKL
jgi:hypothetical protein